MDLWITPLALVPTSHRRCNNPAPHTLHDRTLADRILWTDLFNAPDVYTNTLHVDHLVLKDHS